MISFLQSELKIYTQLNKSFLAYFVILKLVAFLTVRNVVLNQMN